MVEHSLKCVVADSQSIIFTSSDDGIRPMMKVLELWENKEISPVFLADKIIGKAALYIASRCGIKEIYTEIISESALAMAERLGIRCDYSLKVPMILNRDGTSEGPFESRLHDTGDGDYDKAIAIIKEQLKKMSPLAQDDISIIEYSSEYVKDAVAIWNEVVDDGIAFPQLEDLTEETGDEFFRSQSFTGLAIDNSGEILGLYILHPNNIGRCGHIANASYAVRHDLRGRHIGEKLVIHCLSKAKDLGFRIMQFNAVVATNTHALNLYKRLGFKQLGTIPGGFLMPDGHYEDIIVHYKEL